MKKIRIMTQYDFDDLERFKEINDQPSMTIVGEAYTIRELLEKHVNGIDVNIGRTPVYNSQTDWDDIDLEKYANMDLTEKDELLTNVKQSVSNKTQQLNDLKKRIQQETVEVEPQNQTQPEQVKSDSVKV
nr:MAG: hypothetical protein [Microvirus sp.]